MSNFIMLIGLPASGKSTWAKNNTDDNTVWLSSDNLRIELFNDVNCQGNNNDLFNIMNKRTRDLLISGKNVIYDATNISSKRRIALIKYLKKTKCKYICYYFSKSINDCIYLDEKRDRSVGVDIINKMYLNLQIPMYHEGWDEINIINSNTLKVDIDCDVNSYNDYIEKLLGQNYILRQSIDMPQDSKYHTLSLSRHMYYTYAYVKNRHGDRLLQLASMLHDIGKPYCKSFGLNDRYAHYYGHENISAQLAIYLLYNSGLKTEDCITICTYIQLHMRLLNSTDKGFDKFMNILNDNKLFDDLVLLRNADMSAH